MADLLLETHDRFMTMYDALVLLNQNKQDESVIASYMHLSLSTAQQLLSFMLAQGFVKTAGSDTEFKITTLGSSFLHDFNGMRKFLS